MPTIYFDGQPYQAERGQTIIQVADGINNGGKKIVDIPRFCYHPSLSIAGNCRMCLVEMGLPKKSKEGGFELDDKGNPVIQWIPKLTTACSTEIMDGMHVRTHHTSETVAEAQKGVLEFILINHPLDCPICDQAGECPLQEITYTYGPEGSRFEFEKVHKPKRNNWGSKITFDAERCINCTRCVRFFDEYTKTHELEIVQRGWNNYPAPSPSANIDSNSYAMNVIDLCPVGALTSTDHRFKARVWEMSATDTISVQDARCSSIRLWVRDNRVMRITARENPLVNGYYISDIDRLNYQWINDNRIDGPFIKEGQTLKPASWESALHSAVKVLQSYSSQQIFVLASAHATLETNWVAQKLASDVLGCEIGYVPHIKGEDDDLLIRADKTPNASGCELLQIQAKSENELSEKVKSGHIKCLLVVEDDLENCLSQEAMNKLDAIIVLAYNRKPSHNIVNVLFPAATFAEQIGSYINFEGVIQLSKPAKALKFQNRELMKEMALSRLDKHATQFDAWSQDKNKIDAKPGWEIIIELAEKLDQSFGLSTAREIFNEIANQIQALKNIEYQAIGKTGLKLEFSQSQTT